MVDFSVQQVYMALNELKSARGLTDEQRKFWEDMKPVDVYALLYALERTIPEEDDAESFAEDAEIVEGNVVEDAPDTP